MFETTTVRANGLRFSVIEEGEGDDLALCLHGFPELGYSYRHQIPVLRDLGMRVWAPDLRGYGRTERPKRMRDYAIEHLMDDVSGLIEAAGARRVTLIAHDWGGFIAWHLAMRRPEQIDRLVILNMSHPALYLRAIRRLQQLRKSWYVLMFQIPGLAERLLASDDYRAIENAFTGSAVHPERFLEEDLRRYREAAMQDGALRAMLSYYRAYVLLGGALRERRRGYPVIDVPTLMLFGERDTAIGKETVVGTSQLVSDLTLRYLPDASHWVQQDDPETVNAMLVAWLEGRPVPQAWEVEVSGSPSPA